MPPIIDGSVKNSELVAPPTLAKLREQIRSNQTAEQAKQAWTDACRDLANLNPTDSAAIKRLGDLGVHDSWIAKPDDQNHPEDEAARLREVHRRCFKLLDDTTFNPNLESKRKTDRTEKIQTAANNLRMHKDDFITNAWLSQPLDLPITNPDTSSTLRGTNREIGQLMNEVAEAKLLVDTLFLPPTNSR